MRYSFIDRIRRSGVECEVMVVELKEEAFAINLKRSEVMLAIGIIIRAKIIEAANYVDGCQNKGWPPFMHPIGMHHRTATNTVTSKLIIEVADFRHPSTVLLVHNHLHPKRRVRNHFRRTARTAMRIEGTILLPFYLSPRVRLGSGLSASAISARAYAAA
jgi:hypothetical protein